VSGPSATSLDPKSPSIRHAVKIVIALAAVAALLVFGRGVAARLPEFAAWVKGLGFWGPAAFVAGYGVAAVVLAPAFLLTVVAGAIWGFVGVLYVMIGATLGAVLAFFTSRYFVRQLVEHYVARHPKLAAIDRAVESEGFRLILLLRLSPIVSYVLLNYILGISRVRFRDYLAASIGMLPTVVAYVYAGKVAGDVVLLAGRAATPRGTLGYVAIAFGLAATVAATALITRAARRAIERDRHLQR
jgi:uncharacterized membrane protein YdjX (TVP38/TMEM64 family)